LRAFGAVFKGWESGENKTPRAKHARGCGAAHVRLGLEVEDEPDRWAHLVVTQRRGTLLSAAEARRGRRAALVVPWAARWAEARHWADARKKGERGQAGREGGEEKWAEPETGRRKFFSIF